MPDHASGSICNGRFTIVPDAVLGEEVWFAAPRGLSAFCSPNRLPGAGAVFVLITVFERSDAVQPHRPPAVFLEQLKSDGFHRHLPKEAASE